MSRQESARAALRSLTSHAEGEGAAIQRGNSMQPLNHQLPPPPAPSSSTSYFGGGALEITDSPSSSPTLGPSHSTPDDGQSLWTRNKPGEGSMSAVGVRDLPSLSLSNSSFSDASLRSPFNEHAPSQTSVSSNRTVKQHHYHQHPTAGDAGDCETGLSKATLHRIAANMQMPVDDVRRVERRMTRDSTSLATSNAMEDVEGDQDVEDMGEDRFFQVAQAVSAEEEWVAQIDSFRSAYLRAGPHGAADSGQQRSQHKPSALQLHPIPHSPPPAYDQLDFARANAPIPSPRAALESLTASSSSSTNKNQSRLHSMSAYFEQPLLGQHPHRNAHWNTSSSPYHTHTRQSSSGSRPVSLPDRSYRSMDDYTAPVPLPSPLLRSGHNLPIRSSAYYPAPSPSHRQSVSRPASRSPMVGSPQLLQDEDGGVQTTPQSYRPDLISSRHRSPSLNDSEGLRILTKTSRRASAEVLGQSIARTSSPLAMAENRGNSSSSTVAGPPSYHLPSSHSQPLSHQEVMARLQRKVKERLAAKGAGRDYSSSNIIVGGSGREQSVGSSPTMSKHSSLPYGVIPGSIGRSGRRRQGSAAGQHPPSAAARRSHSSNRKPRKSASLKGLSGSLEERRVDDNGGEDARMEDAGMEDAKMEEVGMPSRDNGSASMGIEALLSAAAIADSPRMGHC